MIFFFKQKETVAEAKELGQEVLARSYWVYCLRRKAVSALFEKITQHMIFAMTLNVHWSC